MTTDTSKVQDGAQASAYTEAGKRYFCVRCRATFVSKREAKQSQCEIGGNHWVRKL